MRMGDKKEIWSQKIYPNEFHVTQASMEKQMLKLSAYSTRLSENYINRHLLNMLHSETTQMQTSQSPCTLICRTSEMEQKKCTSFFKSKTKK